MLIHDGTDGQFQNKNADEQQQTVGSILRNSFRLRHLQQVQLVRQVRGGSEASLGSWTFSCRLEAILFI